MSEVKLKEIEEMTFEEAMKEFEEIVKKIDSGQESLENSLQAFDRGAKLKAYCEKKLQEARFKLEKIIQQADGTITTENL